LMRPTSSWPKSAWDMGPFADGAPAPGTGSGSRGRLAYFFAAGQACCSTVGNAWAAGMVFRIL
jgi:hypothetical protein